MQKRFLVFQHTQWEGPGRYLIRSAEKSNVYLHIVELWHQPIPDIGSYAGLIVLGGGPNVGQEDLYLFLANEKEFISNVIKQDIPYMGFCLGHQLLADALGAKVGPNSVHSVGFIEGKLTRKGSEHPLFRDIPRSLPLFKWHSQAILQPVPKSIEILAISGDCEVEAISPEGRPHIIGLQFDNHAADYEDAEKWLGEDKEWLSTLSPPAVNPACVLGDARRLEAIMEKQFEILFRNYMEIIS
jgi:GMP synthase-like glutamine amidotransferase